MLDLNLAISAQLPLPALLGAVEAELALSFRQEGALRVAVVDGLRVTLSTNDLKDAGSADAPYERYQALLGITGHQARKMKQLGARLFDALERTGRFGLMMESSDVRLETRISEPHQVAPHPV